jgi:hypothetical protein
MIAFFIDCGLRSPYASQMRRRAPRSRRPCIDLSADTPTVSGE